MKKFSMLFLLLIAACTPSRDIIPPDASVPPQFAVFSCKWEGYWGKDKELESSIIVDEVRPDGNIRGHYFWKDNPLRKITAGNIGFISKIQKNSFVFGREIHFEFELEKDGSLTARRYVSGAQAGYGKFKKIPC